MGRITPSWKKPFYGRIDPGRSSGPPFHAKSLDFFTVFQKSAKLFFEDPHRIPSSGMHNVSQHLVLFIVPQKFPHHPLTFEGTNPFTSVFIEYLIYSAALAVIVGRFFSRFKGTDPSWIIIAVVPDIS